MQPLYTPCACGAATITLRRWRQAVLPRSSATTLNAQGNPPALPEDSASLTVPGMLGRLGISRGLFPLTLALFPEERGNYSPSGGRIERYEVAKEAVEGASSSQGRENYRSRGDKSRHPDILRDERQSPFSLGERERPSPTLA